MKTTRGNALSVTVEGAMSSSISRRRATGSPLVADESPVRGLTRRQLPFIPVFAQSVAAIAPAGTSAVTPLFVIAAISGSGGVLAFAAAAVVIMLVAACIRPMAQRLAVVGGLYSYVAQGFGPRVALPTAWSAILGYGSVSMAGLLAVGLYLSHIAVSLGVAAAPSVIAMCVIVVASAAVMTVLMVRGVKVSATAILGIEIVAVVIMVGLMLWLGITHRGAGYSAAFTSHIDPGSMGLNIVVAVSAFVGFESATTLSAEARRPFRSVPRTLMWTPPAAAVIYLLAVTSQSVAMAGAPERIRESPTPLAALFLSEGTRVASVILDLGIATSFFACALASVNALVRVLFTLGREQVVPAGFGRAHRRFHTPAFATVCAMGAVVAGPLIFLWCGGNPQTGIRDFLTLSALGYMGSYLTACLAAPAMLRRIGEASRAITVLGAVTATILVVLLVTGFTTDVGSGRVLCAIYVISMIVVVVAVAVVARCAPTRFGRVGVFDATSRDDILTVTLR
ncbi:MULTISPECIES: APC family permease [Gordonia]|uniref:APC family permease n=1 Tax=Gordonia TaxID=2053 RepID=UPI002301A457|nr:MULTISPECIES: APC family permease [Gordonia]MDF3280998.1 APC family permease [Gordonia sp. N1V]WCB37114.1 APC family permease [Gordonia polyisoprenivorans]